MSTRFEPMGLSALTNVAMRAELQSLPCNQQRAVESLRNPDLGAQALSELILNDPVLTATVLREVGRQIKNRPHRSIAGISHCLTLLGMESTGTLVRMTRSLPAESKDEEESGYREALVTSLHAAAQAGDWQRLQPLLHFEQSYLGALLLGLPEWCLWKQSPKEMKMVATLVNRYGVPRTDAEKQVLGCTLGDAALRIAQEWRLSDVAQSALDPRHVPKLPALMRWARKALRSQGTKITYRDESVHRPEISGTLRALLANWIALESRRDWHGKNMHRCIRLLAAYLEITEDDAWRRVRDTALAMAREVPDPLTAQLAAGLLWPAKGTPRRRIKPEMLSDAVQRLYNNELVKTVTPRVAAPASAPQPAMATSTVERPVSTAVPASPTGGAGRVYAPEPPPTTSPRTTTVAATAKQPGFASMEKQALFEQHIARLLGNGQPFKVEHEVIRAGVDILKECSSLERIVVALVHINRGNIVSYYAVGCEKAQGLRRFEIKLQPPSLFTRLTKQAAAVWMSPERQKDAVGLLPGHFKQATQMDSYFAASLFNSKGAFAMLYADKGNSYGALAEPDYQIFRMLVNGSNKCLAAMKA